MWLGIQDMWVWDAELGACGWWDQGDGWGGCVEVYGVGVEDSAGDVMGNGSAFLVMPYTGV